MRWLAAIHALAVSLMLLPACARALDIVIDGIDPDIQNAPDKNAPLPEGAIAKSGPGAGDGAAAETLSKVCLSPDGTRAATAAEDGSVRIWDMANAKVVTTIKAHERECRDVRFATDGKSLFSCSADSTVRQWDAATGKEVRKLEGGEGDVRSLACSPDGLRLAAADAKGIRVWDLKSGRQLRLITGHRIPPEYLAAQQAAMDRANDDDDAVVIGGNVIIQGGGVIAVGGGVAAEPLSVTVDALVFSPDGRTLVSEANDETARIWDALHGKELRVLPHHDGANAAVALSPDGILGVSTRGVRRIGAVPRLRLWEVSTGKILRTLVGHGDDINCNAFSPDGRYVLSGSSDRTLRQWEVDTGVEVRRYYLSSPVMSVAYGPNGKFAVTVSLHEGVVIWDMAALPVVRGTKVAIASFDDAWQKLAAPLYEARSAAFRYYSAEVPAADAAADLQRRLSVKGSDAAARVAQQRLIETLDNPDYANRAMAYKDLAEMGEKARAELVVAMKHSSPEVRARAGELLAAIGGPADFRSVLAIEILFALKTPAAQATLEAAASSGIPSAAHAKALLARLGK